MKVIRTQSPLCLIRLDFMTKSSRCSFDTETGYEAQFGFSLAYLLGEIPDLLARIGGRSGDFYFEHSKTGKWSSNELA